ncbi:MAG: hypothetical protein OHK93_007777 [Ramalina farinacea]|uniref:NmrA-like domain-containing protein n=1 Tax=Ramalina farinacea TaxID=258253 RepID=A0AA43QL66_9LECA|nr:hypothetical protein [Ramalina farinacea]
MAFDKIALIGGTGALGSHILNALLSTFAPSSIILLTRQSSKPPTVPSGVTTIPLPSYTDSSAVIPALKGCDVLISALGTKALSLEPQLVDSAIAAGVRRFIPSEFTKDVTEAEYRRTAKADLALHRIRWADERARIADQGKIAFTTFVTGPLIDASFQEEDFWPFDFRKKRAILYGGGTGKRTGCSMQFTGTCVAAVLKMPESRTKNQRIRIAETELTGRQLLDCLEAATGGGKWETEIKPLSDLTKQEEEDLRNGDMGRAYTDSVVRGDFDDSPSGYLPDGLEWGNDREVEITRKSLQQIVEEVVRLESKTHS